MSQKHAELHQFADPRFVVDGFSLFVWCVNAVADGTPLQDFPPAFGSALDVTEMSPPPSTFARYNPDTGEWAEPLADDFVPELHPLYRAGWNNETWRIAPIEEPI